MIVIFATLIYILLLVSISWFVGAFFFLNMFATMESLEFCKYFTLQTLFDMEKVIKGESVVPQMISLAVVAVPFYAIDTLKFLKKDLPL